MCVCKKEKEMGDTILAVCGMLAGWSVVGLIIYMFDAIEPDACNRAYHGNLSWEDCFKAATCGPIVWVIFIMEQRHHKRRREAAE